MADMRDETRTTGTTTDSVSGTPQVQVFDNNRTTSGTDYTTTRTGMTTEPARAATNWTMIILAILVIAALIYLLMWLF